MWVKCDDAFITKSSCQTVLESQGYVYLVTTAPENPRLLILFSLQVSSILHKKISRRGIWRTEREPHRGWLVVHYDKIVYQ